MYRMKLRVCGVMALAMLSGIAFAGNTTSMDTDDSLAQLEAQLEAQSARLAALRSQVAATAEPNMAQARADSMKQQIREVLGEQEFRESLMPTTLQAGYDDGFFIRSTDDKFKMQFNGFVQMRWTHYGTRENNRYLSPGLRRSDRTGFDAERVRFIVSGNVYDEDLTYYMHFLSDSSNGYDTALLWGWIDYAFGPELHVQAGLLSIPSTRQTYLDERGYQFIDRSMVDNVFGLGDGVGVMLWGQLFVDKSVDYYLSITNSLNGPGNRTITTDETRELDGNPAIAFRTVWHAMGKDPTAGLYEGDFEHVQEPVLDIEFHYAFNEDDGDAATTAIPFPRRTFFRKGGFGVTNSNGLQIHQAGVAAAFKYNGFSATAEYIMRSLDVRNAEFSATKPFAPLFLMTGDDSTNIQHGAYVQCGYFLPIPGHERKFEAVARVGGISALSSSQEASWEYAGGLNYYIKGHNVKLQTDLTKYVEVPIAAPMASMANVNDDALVWRIQLQVAF